MVTAVQKYYYGYGSVIDVRESFRVSCVRGLIEFGRVLRVAVSSCVTELVEFRRVY
jgi:hypothetical protein